MPAFAPIRPTRTAVVFAGSLLALSAPALSAADVPEGGDDAPLTRGAELFATMCADCHGERGEGVEDLYDSPLHGDLSVGQLAEVIAKTMPEGDPESVVGEDAKLVAQYAHDVFYSRTAQLRNAPPRVELSRLTEGQYRRTIADLGAAFTGYRAPGDERGLNVEYKSRTGPWQKRLAFKRIEPQLDLFLGGELPQPNDGDETGPANGKLEEEGFQIDWDGALLPPVTGEYTIVVEASNQMYLTVNGEELVNAKVRSGEQTRYEVDVFLIAGRPTPIRVQMEKRLGKRFDKDPRKYDFFGKLSWIVPHRAETVIPTRALLPGWTPRTLLVSTPFPPDDRSIGYERGSSVSAAWDEATTEAAFEVVESLLESDGSISDFLRIRTKDSFEEKTKKAREFCAKWTERAFRRPLTDEQRAAYVDAHFVDGRHWQECVQRSVLMTLKSPYFLYPNLHAAIAAANGEEPDSYDRLAATSLALWDGLPEDWMYKEAGKGTYADDGQLRGLADQMSRDHRATVKLAEFFADWLIPEGSHEMAKDETLYPGFDDAVVGDLRTSLELTIADALANDDAELTGLWNANHLFLNERLAELYKDDLQDPGAVPTGGSFAKLAVREDRRTGLLTHPLLMAGYAHHRVSSPIHRGVFVARKLLGRHLKPPKEAFSPLPEDFGDGLTTRERVAHQTADAACSACHNTINPLGFSLEQFDAIGRFRTTERLATKTLEGLDVKPVDPAGVYPLPTGEEVTLRGAADLNKLVAESAEARTAFVERLFHHAVKQPTAAYGLTTRETLAEQFEANGTNIRAAFAAAATVAALGPPREAPDRTAGADPPSRN